MAVKLAQVRDPWTLLWLEVGEFKRGLAGQAKRAGLSLRVTVSALPYADDISPILKRLANYDWVFGGVSVGTCSSSRSLTLRFIYFSFGRLAEDYSRLGGILENGVPLETALLRMLSRLRAKDRTDIARLLLQVDDLPHGVRAVALSRALETFWG